MINMIVNNKILMSYYKKIVNYLNKQQKTKDNYYMEYYIIMIKIS